MIQQELAKHGIEIVITGAHSKLPNGKASSICFTYYNTDKTHGGKLYTQAGLTPGRAAGQR